MKKAIKLMCVLLIGILLCGCNSKPSVNRGVVEGDVYTNESIGITFTKPANWRFYSDEEMAELLDISAEMYKDESLLETSKLTTIFDFMAIDSSTGNNINLGIENLQASWNTKMTVEEYIEISKKNMEEQLQDATYSFADPVSATLGDVEFVRLDAKCSYSGITMKQHMYIQKFGNCMVTITCTSMNGMSAERFEGMFA